MNAKIRFTLITGLIVTVIALFSLGLYREARQNKLEQQNSQGFFPKIIEPPQTTPFSEQTPKEMTEREYQVFRIGLEQAKRRGDQKLIDEMQVELDHTIQVMKDNNWEIKDDPRYKEIQ